LALIEVRDQERESLLRPTAEGIAWLQAARAETERLQRLGRWAELRDAAPQAMWVIQHVPSQGLRFPQAEVDWLTVTPGVRVSIPLAAPAAATFQVAQFARLQPPSPAGAARQGTTYQVTRQTLCAHLARGGSVEGALLALHRFSHSPAGESTFSQEARAELEAWGRQLRQLQVEPGYRLQAAGAGTMEALRQRVPFRRRTRACASRQHAWVSQQEARALFAYLRRLGYVLQPTADQRLPLLSPALRMTLPLPQLLVALRTYAHLRATVPGLAAPDLEPLAGEIAAALSPEQLAGVQQAIESNVILLAWAGEERMQRDTDASTPPQVPEAESQETFAREDPVQVPPSPQPDVPERLQAALRTGEPVELIYADARAQLTQRTVRPLRIEQQREHARGPAVLVAHCALRREERHFRLDRVLSVQEPGQADPDPLPFPE
jgi:predicted DNA-binding transcriptional regulator YafY